MASAHRSGAVADGNDASPELTNSLAEQTNGHPSWNHLP
jgi:hypothetical protein